ncbi:MAG: AAA family ATPase [Firmicutes bacterium]|nr:AAA family ATPase [Bacillota bacterium]
MKRLYLIGGTMGVGKTAVGQELKLKLDNSVFLDGDWCWDAHPFQVTAETKKMVMENICFLLNQFIHCSAYESIIFCWVMHEQSIIDAILNNLDTTNCEIKTISLVCDEQELLERLSQDIAAGKREPDVVERSLARLSLYHQLNTVKIDTTRKTVSEIAEEIARI